MTGPTTDWKACELTGAWFRLWGGELRYAPMMTGVGPDRGKPGMNEEGDEPAWGQIDEELADFDRAVERYLLWIARCDDPVRNALLVMVKTVHIKDYLERCDPMALRQAEKALGD